MNEIKILLSAGLTFISMVILLFLLLSETCNKPNDSANSVIFRTDTVKIIQLDTIKNEGSTRYIYKVDSVLIPAPALVDTQAILEQFFTSYTYIDTIADSVLFARSVIEIEQNAVINHSLQYEVVRPREIITITNELMGPRKRMLLIGASAGANKNLVASFTPEIILVGKKRSAIGGGYDLLNQSPQLKAYFIISK